MISPANFFFPIIIESLGRNKEKLEKKNKQVGSFLKQERKSIGMKIKQKQKILQKNFLQKH